MAVIEELKHVVAGLRGEGGQPAEGAPSSWVRASQTS